MAYVFLSYAHEDWNPFLARFFAELAEELHGRAGLVGEFTVAETGAWRDGDAIEAGDHWPDAITAGLSTCRVFVPVYTPNYFKRPWCGKEWALFQERLRRTAGTEEAKRRLVFPVVWLPVDPPAPLAHVQYVHDALGDEYKEVGLLDLVRLGKYADAYTIFKREAANAIRQRVAALPLPPAEGLDVANALNAFEGAGEAATPAVARRLPEPAPKRLVYVLVVAPRGQVDALPRWAWRDGYRDHPTSWRPYIPERDEDIGNWLDALTHREGGDWGSSLLPGPLDPPDSIYPDADSLRGRLETALARRFTVVIVVDNQTLLIPHFRELLKAYDHANLPNTGVVVVRRADASQVEQLDDAVRDTFERTIWRGETAVQAAVTTPEAFEERLVSLFSELRTRVAQTQVPGRTAGNGGHSRFYDINPLADA